MNGRCDLNPTIIIKILNFRDYKYESFMKLITREKAMPANDSADCVEILKGLDKEKLGTVKTILESF